MNDDNQMIASDEPTEADVDEMEFTASELMAVMPPAVRNYLLSPRIEASRKLVYDKNGLNEAERAIALHTELEVFFGTISLDDFPDFLFTELPWSDSDEERAKTLAVDILGHILLPAQAWTGDVVSLLAELGADASSFPQEQIEPRTVVLSDVANSLVEAVGLGEADPSRRKRFAFIAETRLKDIRDSEETKEQLMKQYKVGGLDMTAEEAEQAVSLMENEMHLSKFVDATGAVITPLFSPGRSYTAEDIQKIYVGSDEEQRVLGSALSRVISETKRNPRRVLERLVAALSPTEQRVVPEKWEVTAALIAAASFGGVPEGLEEVEDLRGIVVDYLEENGTEDDVREAVNEPMAQENLNIFIQIVLRGYAGFDPKDSARLGLRAINAISRRGSDRYRDLVVFDGEAGSFKWTTPIKI